MLSLIKKWLGLEPQTSSVRPDLRRTSATAHLFAKDSPATRRAAADGTARPKPKPDPGFDPYNTGKFDRSASWEKISKNQR